MSAYGARDGEGEGFEGGGLGAAHERERKGRIEEKKAKISKLGKRGAVKPALGGKIKGEKNLLPVGSALFVPRFARSSCNRVGIVAIGPRQGGYGVFLISRYSIFPCGIARNEVRSTPHMTCRVIGR